MGGDHCLIKNEQNDRDANDFSIPEICFQLPELVKYGERFDVKGDGPTPGKQKQGG